MRGADIFGSRLNASSSFFRKPAANPAVSVNLRLRSERLRFASFAPAMNWAIFRVNLVDTDRSAMGLTPADASLW